MGLTSAKTMTSLRTQKATTYNKFERKEKYKYHIVFGPSSYSSCIRTREASDLHLCNSQEGGPGSCAVCLLSAAPQKETPGPLAAICQETAS